jgi:hypothetical protein
MNSTVVIHGCGLELLEKQRLTLHTITAQLTPEQRTALDGVINMLDAWSDERHNSQDSSCKVAS